MSSSITSSGRICLCEWSGAVTVAMVVSLLSHLRTNDAARGEQVVLIISLRPSSAKSIIQRSRTFIDVLPAMWIYCQEVVLACEGEPGLLEQLRRYLCGSASTPIATLAHPLSFFEHLDEALSHAQGVFPHDVLAMRRQRLKSGMWSISESAEERKCR